MKLQRTTYFGNSCAVVLLLLLASPQSCFGKPSGEYSTLAAGEFGGATDVISGTYSQSLLQGNPSAVVLPSATKGDLKPASSLDISYGAPQEALIPILPFGKFGGGGGVWGGFGGGFGGFGGGGWKPQPIFAPIPIIAKPISIPISTFPLGGWGWPGPGIF